MLHYCLQKVWTYIFNSLEETQDHERKGMIIKDSLLSRWLTIVQGTSKMQRSALDGGILKFRFSLTCTHVDLKKLKTRSVFTAQTWTKYQNPTCSLATLTMQGFGFTEINQHRWTIKKGLNIFILLNMPQYCSTVQHLAKSWLIFKTSSKIRSS